MADQSHSQDVSIHSFCLQVEVGDILGMRQADQIYSLTTMFTILVSLSNPDTAPVKLEQWDAVRQPVRQSLVSNKGLPTLSPIPFQYGDGMGLRISNPLFLCFFFFENKARCIRIRYS